MPALPALQFLTHESHHPRAWSHRYAQTERPA